VIQQKAVLTDARHPRDRLSLG